MNQETTKPAMAGKVSAELVHYLDCRPTEKGFTKVAGTKEELFRSFYNLNRHLRYCNGEYYKFQSKEMEAEYNKWYDSLSDSERFDMYYGDGIVD